MRSVVVFDGDDTLWWTEPVYDAARSRAAECVARAGLDATAWETHERAIDVDNVARFGLGRDRFPTSCVEAYERIASDARRPLDPEVRARVWTIAASVFTTPAPVADGAPEVLRILAAERPLALLTRGDREVQELRIARSGLARWFERIDIVPDKTPERFAALLRAMRGEALRSWSVGNSRRSDIDPALAVGMRAVWIDAHVWEYERLTGHTEHENLYVAATLRDVLGIILPKRQKAWPA